MAGDRVASELTGQTIKEIFDNAEDVAEMHACLTSPRGDNFRLSLLQAMEAPLDEPAIEGLRVESGLIEYHRHLNRLLRLGFAGEIQVEGDKRYVRTEPGETAVNAVREFERRVGEEASQLVFSATLGPNSIRLFLRIYGDSREADWGRLQIRYTPAEIGRLSLFLPRTIEGISAIDKLNEADLLAYRDDDHVHMHPLKARSFYQYLLELYKIAPADGRARKNQNGDRVSHEAPMPHVG